MLNLERANAIDVFNDEMARLKAQLEVMADHFESTSSLFDGNTYAHFTYSLLASGAASVIASFAGCTGK